MSATVDRDALRRLAEELAHAAGRYIVDERPADLQVGSKSSINDAVTVMDAGAEELIRAALRQRRPDDAILGEEGDSESGTSGITWVVDPIDGTVNYVYGIAAYAVSVAAVTGPATPTEWTAEVGAVYCPVRDVMWSAARGGGATRDGQVLKPTQDPPLGTALVGTGFGYDPDRRAAQGAVVARLLPKIRDIRRAGAASLDLCAVADGTLDAYYERGLGPWDHAAGALIAREAGRDVSGLRSAAASNDMIIAGPCGLHAALRAELQDLVVDE